MSNYWFFLSYARRNDVSYSLGERGDVTQQLVRRLYEELAAEIINNANTGDARSIEEIGFFDQAGIEPGDTWDVKVAEALRTSRVMLCLFTHNYFNTSPVSGQEVEVFRSRIEGYAKTHGASAPPLIIPILWHPEDRLPKRLPDVVANLQYVYADFSKVYAERGLEAMMRLERRYHDDYQEFLINLATRVIDVAVANPLSPLDACPPLRTVKNAFAPATPPIPAGVAARVGAGGAAGAAADPRLANTGPGFAHFVFIAGQAQELQAIRKAVEPYDKDGRLWKPYLPGVGKPVALFTQRAATEVDLQHEVLPPSAALIEQLRTANATNTIVVLIVDPWTLNVQTYQDYMKLYDETNFVSCAVLIVWNPDDQDPALSQAQLQQKVRETFSNILTTRNIYLRDTVNSAADLSKELVSAIVEIRRRLDERAQLFRPIDAGGFGTVPQLSVASEPPRGTPP